MILQQPPVLRVISDSAITKERGKNLTEKSMVRELFRFEFFMSFLILCCIAF